MDEPVYRSMRHWMLQQDPPDHTRLRGLVVKAFTARRVEDMRPRIQQIVDATLDRVEPQGFMDVIADFAFRLARHASSAKCWASPGRPPAVLPRVHAPAGGCSIPCRSRGPRSTRPTPATCGPGRVFPHVCSSCAGAGRATISPAQLVQAEEEGSKLSNEELTANIILLFGAGHETTVNLIGNGVLALASQPRPAAATAEAIPSLIANAIEEFLRYDSSVQLTGRTALEAVAVAGTEVAEGETVLCLLGAANRDPAVYARPRPARYHAPEHPPLVIRGGIHFCLGAQLARIEAEIAIATLLRRLPRSVARRCRSPRVAPDLRAARPQQAVIGEVVDPFCRY